MGHSLSDVGFGWESRDGLGFAGSDGRMSDPRMNLPDRQTPEWENVAEFPGFDSCFNSSQQRAHILFQTFS
jgi:hypothetical protein